MSDTAIEIASGAVTVTTTWRVYAFSIYSWHRLAFLLPFVFGFVGGLIGFGLGAPSALLIALISVTSKVPVSSIVNWGVAGGVCLLVTLFSMGTRLMDRQYTVLL